MYTHRVRFSFGLIAAGIALASVAAAGIWFAAAPPEAGGAQASGPGAAPVVTVEGYDRTGLAVRITVPGVNVEQVTDDHGDFVVVTMPGTQVGGRLGAPGLPVIRRLFAVPVGTDVQLAVTGGQPREIDLTAAGFTAALRPFQYPSAIDAETVRAVYGDQPDVESLVATLVPAFAYDKAAYAQDASVPAEPVAVHRLGVMRQRQLYLLEVYPAAYNPVQGTLTVWPELDVQLSFSGDTDPSALPSPPLGLRGVVLNPETRSFGKSRGGNYLIVLAEDFAGSAPLTQFVDAKTAQGFNVTTYTATAGTSRDTIKAYIQSLWGTTDAPDYLLIVGDAVGGLHGADETATSNTIPAWSGGGANEWVTDLPYACMDAGDDWIADIAFGRLPVQTAAQFQGVVDKILTVESGNVSDPTYAQRAAFLAHPAPEANAEALHNHIIDTYMTPNGIQSYKLYYETYGARTQDVVDAINSGCFIGVYYGHSSGFQAWSAPYISTDDIAGLSNATMYPFIISFSCSGGQFQYPMYDPGVVEQWVRVSNRGGAAGVGFTGPLMYAWSTWEDLYNSIFAAIYDDGVRELGPMWQATMNRMLTIYGAGDPVCRDYAESFAFLGDPSMELPTYEPPQKNYLIVTAEDYVDSAPLNDFVAMREASGMNVTVHSVAPGTSNTDIKSYIQSLWGTTDAPDYVLLIGDTDGSTATSSCIPHFSGGGDKHAATDWPYVCMDAGDDWYPEIPIGRFSVRDVATLRNVVDKTIFVEQGNYPDPDYVKRGAFLANSGTQGMAEPSHDYVIDTYFTPNDYEGIKLYAAQGAGTSDVADAVNNGVLFTVYYGHSGSSGWWEPAFDQSNVNALMNTGLYGVAMGWSCNTAHYTYDECFGETWLRAANRGAAAYISASDYIYWGSVEAWQPSTTLERSFFAALFEDGQWRLGDAWRTGLYRFLADYGGWDGDPNHAPAQHADVCRNFFEEFVLLGDPALQLPRPNGFTLTSTPESHLVCSPPTDEATYNIDVARLGTFDETVTLTASGLPAGATVSFSTNDQAPPFTSTMTVGNLTGVLPGSYSLTVTGTSASKQRSIPITLGISADVPGAPKLLSPADGAVDVPRRPTLSWQAGAEAMLYDIQIATDAGFTNIVYSATTTDKNVTLESNLNSATTYYWRVRAENGCGSSAFTTPYQFTTIVQADYFTEEFTGTGGDAFDLDGYTVQLIPDGSGDYYRVCIQAATSLPTDPAGGTTLNISDDGSANVSPGTSVSLYGVDYTAFYVNANGNITFSSSDSTYSETLDVHFGQPRISALFDDLNPAAGGTISWKATADRVAVTWQSVPEYGTSDSNTFQIEMLFNGEIHITWIGIDSPDSIVGLSAGGGVPSDYVESDLSASFDCAGPPTGACCTGETCAVLSEADCTAGGGVYLGDDTSCDPNPCGSSDSSCLIISEVVQGTESGGCPRWVEITNTGLQDFLFLEGGLIVQTDDSSDVDVDVDLTGVLIPAGDSFVIDSYFSGTCTGAFNAIYPEDADMHTNVPFGYGNERFILTDTADGSHLIDIYGEFGVNGAGTQWEFTNGYAYRLPNVNSGSGSSGMADEWYFGGVGSLSGDDPTQLLLTLTTPGTHQFDHACCDLFGDLNSDGIIDLGDLAVLLANYGTTSGATYEDGDLEPEGGDGDVDLSDLAAMLAVYGATCQ